MNGDWDDGFYGIPFEGLGDVNDAVYPGGAAALVARLKDFIGGGRIARERVLAEGDLKTLVFLYPGKGAVNLGLLASALEGSLSAVSLYPVLEGLPNDLSVVNFMAWENGMEGIIAAQTASMGLFSFFDPFYYWDHWQIGTGKKSRFDLAALAFTFGFAQDEEFEVSEGALYEMSLKLFLMEHPGKTKDDFRNLKISMRDAQLLLPARYTGEYHYRARVLAAEKTDLLGQPLWRYRLSFAAELGIPSPELWLYASPHVMRGSDPKPGDFIEGVCWLSGCLHCKSKS